MNNPLQSPLVEGLSCYREKSRFRFHMPGHKGRIPEEFREFYQNIFLYDVTELGDTDDLYYSYSFIRKSKKDLAFDRHSMESHYLVNGSTVGILASILGLTTCGDSILIEAGCHKSVHNAIDLGGLCKITLETQFHKEGIPLPAEQKDILKTLKKNPEIKILFLTRPNYYGIAYDLEEVIDYCQENNIYTIIDEAHGSHFLYCNDFPLSAMEMGACVSINSFHKTLPSLTQTAVLNMGELDEVDRRKIRAKIQMLQSSSPSFIFIASMDLSFRYMRKHKEKFPLIQQWIAEFYSKIEDNPHLKNIKIQDKDFTRILLFPTNSTIDLVNYLERKGIYIEMHDEHCLVLISSIMDEKEDFDYLAKVLEKYHYQGTSPQAKNTIEGKGLPIAKCCGKKLLEDVYLYPPGSLFLEKGDILTQSNIDRLLSLRKEGIYLHKNISIDPDLLAVEVDK